MDRRTIDERILASLRGAAEPEEIRELQSWRAASPRNERYFRETARAWELTGDLISTQVGPPPSATEVIGPAERRGGERSELAWREARYSPGWLVTAAAAAAALTVGYGLGGLPGVETGGLSVAEFVTGEHESASIALDDGSVVHLGPRSRLSFLPHGSDRIASLDGMAYFAVAPSESRFRLITQWGDVVVLGTRFEVRTEDELRVLVVEGEVEVNAPGGKVSLGSGDMARSAIGAPTIVTRIEDPAALLDWLGRFMAFQATPLERAAAEIERRYGRSVRIESAELQSLSITAWFSSESFEEVIAVICRIALAQCSIGAEGATLRSARP